MKKLYFLIIAISLIAINLPAQWVFIGGVSGLAGPYPSISVASSSVVWIAAGSLTPQVWRSTNGGVTFTVIPTTGISLDLFCCWALDANTCFVGDGGNPGGTTGGNAKVYKTTNGGGSWSVVLSTGGTAGFINGISFSRTNPLIGIAQSDPPSGAGQVYYVQRTTDGGVTWNSVTCPGVSAAASAQNSVICVDNLYFGFGLNAAPSRVRWTSDGGTTWTTSALGVTGAFVSAYSMNTNKTFGIAGTDMSMPSMARTINGGVSWSSVNLGGNSAYSCARFVPGTSTVFVCSATGAFIRKSTDNGATWTAMATPSSLTGFTHMEIVNEANVLYAYALAMDGTVIKLVESTIQGIIPNTEIPSNFSLKQNYPNPFNPVTTVEFSLPKSGNATLKVYDMLGHEVMTVFNGYKQAGEYRENVDASSLASGVYFYTLQTEGFTDTKKMNLIK